MARLNFLWMTAGTFVSCPTAKQCPDRQKLICPAPTRKKVCCQEERTAALPDGFPSEWIADMFRFLQHYGKDVCSPWKTLSLKQVQLPSHKSLLSHRPDKNTLPSEGAIVGLSRLIYHKRLSKAPLWPFTGGSDILLGQGQGGPTKT